MTEEARRSSNLAVLERFGGRRDGSRLSFAQVTDALQQARAERDDR